MVEEADGANGSEMEEEPPLSPSSDAELVEGEHDRRGVSRTSRSSGEVSEPEVSGSDCSSGRKLQK